MITLAISVVLFFISLFVLMVTWAVLLAVVEESRTKKACPVCRDHFKSIIMTDYTIGVGEALCTKHAAQRRRIWDMEFVLGFDRSGLASDVEWTRQRQERSDGH